MEEAYIATLELGPRVGKEKAVCQHYGNLRNLQWNYTYHGLPIEGGGLLLTRIEIPKIYYHQFLAILDKDTLSIDTDGRIVDDVSINDTPPLVAEEVSVKHINEQIKRKIEGLRTFSSFLENNQKDGDAAFEQDGLDSEEEENETQDRSG